MEPVRRGERAPDVGLSSQVGLVAHLSLYGDSRCGPLGLLVQEGSGSGRRTGRTATPLSLWETAPLVGHAFVAGVSTSLNKRKVTCAMGRMHQPRDARKLFTRKGNSCGEGV